MQKLWRLLSSPRHVIVFEAAARLGSFTRAAQELNVHQPAVSAAIKQLEASLGVSLFSREHRKVTLTAAGSRLFADVTRALETVQNSAEAVSQLSRADYVTMNTSSAFNFYWILPRLAELRAACPGVDLRLQSSDGEPDIDSENISLAVRRGEGTWPDCHAALIAAEEIYPVASPRLMASAAPLRDPSDLLERRLIHLEEPIRPRPTWTQWFAHYGIEKPLPEGGLRLNDYAMVLQAAMASEGFAFGWRHLTDRLVEQNLLDAQRDWTWRTGKGFYLVWSRNRPLDDAARQIRDWVLSNVRTA